MEKQEEEQGDQEQEQEQEAEREQEEKKEWRYVSTILGGAAFNCNYQISAESEGGETKWNAYFQITFH